MQSAEKDLNAAAAERRVAMHAIAARAGSRVAIERWGGSTALEGHVERVEPGAFTKKSALGVEEQRVRVVMRLDSAREAWPELGDGYRTTCACASERSIA